MTDPTADDSDPGYDNFTWYIAKGIGRDFDGGHAAYVACTDKNPTNAIRIATASTHLAAESIAAALNTADAHDADYRALFAAYSALQRNTDSAIDTLKEENAILRELAHCLYMFRDATGRAEAYPGEHLAVKRQLWGAHDRWLESQKG